MRDVDIPFISSYNNQPLVAVKYKSHGITIFYQDQSWSYPKAKEMVKRCTMIQGMPLCVMYMAGTEKDRSELMLGNESMGKDCGYPENFHMKEGKIVWTNLRTKEDEEDPTVTKFFYSGDGGKNFDSFSIKGAVYDIKPWGRYFSYLHSDRKNLSLVEVSDK